MTDPDRFQGHSQPIWASALYSRDDPRRSIHWQPRSAIPSLYHQNFLISSLDALHFQAEETVPAHLCNIIRLAFSVFIFRPLGDPCWLHVMVPLCSNSNPLSALPTISCGLDLPVLVSQNPLRPWRMGSPHLLVLLSQIYFQGKWMYALRATARSNYRFRISADGETWTSITITIK